MKSLKCDLNKSIINIGFMGAVLITCVLCFTSFAYVDPTTEKTYSVFEALFTLDRDFINEHYEFSSILIFRGAMSGYIPMFLPIIVAFPFMMSFCAERNNGLMRFTITRIGKYKYYFSKFFASLISGGLAVLLGVLFFGVISSIFVPNIESYNIPVDELNNMLPNNLPVTVFKILGSAFVYGAISTLPAFLLSSFCKNPYIITCVPFLFVYIWNTALDKIANNAFFNENMELYDKITPFKPNALANLMYVTEIDKSLKITIVFNLAYLLVILLAFIMIMNKRTDKGC